MTHVVRGFSDDDSCSRTVGVKRSNDFINTKDVFSMAKADCVSDLAFLFTS